MMHKLFEPGPWFAAKRLGVGAGWPIAWQGWALLASYAGLITGLAALAKGGARVSALVLFLACTAIFLEIVRRRTAGGWRWGAGK